MKKTKPEARFVKPGELLAISPSNLRKSNTGAFFWPMGGRSTPNERRGDVAIVHVRGEFNHHDEGWGESYETIMKKAVAACAGSDVCDAHKLAYLQSHWGDDSKYQPIEAVPPSAVVFCIDSPGGAVSGLNETVKALKALRKKSKIPFVAYVNEMAASAAYAIACACDEIVCPRSAIIGSIGVIATMVSFSERNKKEGIDVRLLTSGARKADGHLNAPITNDAVKAEQDRVDRLAQDFFKLVSASRGLPVSTIAGYAAGIFLGPQAFKAKLVDAVMSFEDVVLGLSKETPEGSETAGGNKTDRRLDGGSGELLMKSGKSEAIMPIQLDALIKKTEAALLRERDPKKLASLGASLATYKKTKKVMEEMEEDSEPCDDDDDKDDSDDEDEEKMGRMKKSAKPPMKDDEDEDEDEKKGEEDDEDEDEDEEEAAAKTASAAVRLIEAATGMKGRKAIGAAASLFSTAQEVAKDVKQLKRDQVSGKKSSLIQGAVGKYITKKEAKWLQGEKLSSVQGFIEMRQSSGVIVHTDESTLLKPKAVQPGTEESLPDEVREMIDTAVSAWSGDKKSYREQLGADHLKAHTQRLSSASNGVGRF